MTKYDCDFEEWYDLLTDVAAEDGGSVADMEAWREPYDHGLTPEEAWQDED